MIHTELRLPIKRFFFKKFIPLIVVVFVVVVDFVDVCYFVPSKTSLHCRPILLTLII